MAVWLPFGRGRRRQQQQHDDGGALPPPPAPALAADAGAPSSSSSSIPGPLAALPPSLGEFLATAPGVAWIADELSDIHVALPSLRAPTARELNSLVLRSYHRLLTSDAGRRLASTAHARERAAEDVLQVPLFIVEDFVRQRLRSTLARNWGRYAVIVGTRATAATAAVKGLKAGARWLLHRWLPDEASKARRWLEVALDLLVPTELYGALAALVLVVARLHRELSEIQPPPMSNEDGGAAAAAGGDGGEIDAAALFSKGPGAGRR